MHQLVDNSLEAVGIDHFDVLHCPHGVAMPEMLESEDIRAVFATRDYKEGRYLVLATRDGMVKKTEFAAYDTVLREAGLIAVKLDGDDELIQLASVLRGENLEDLPGAERHAFHRGDVASPEDVAAAFEAFRPDAVVHLAAETHVDRSIDGPAASGKGTLARRLAARHGIEATSDYDAVRALRRQGIDPDRESVLKDLPPSQPPLHQAYRFQKDAARVGFDWPDLDGVWAKLREEEDELRVAADAGDQDAIEHELGDVLFAWANLARKLGVHPDVALRRANQRFRTRFHHIEASFGHDREALAAADLATLEAAWQEAKARTRDAG